MDRHSFSVIHLRIKTDSTDTGWRKHKLETRINGDNESPGGTQGKKKFTLLEVFWERRDQILPEYPEANLT